MNKWARSFEWTSASAKPGAGRLALEQHRHHYFAFLSYSHEDAADADWLHKELEHFRVPSSLAGRLTEHGVIPRRLTPIFRDRHELAASHDLGTEIREALEGSHSLIVLCSPSAARSKWTNEEIELFKRFHPEACVIAAIVRGEPFASEMKGRESEECLPPALRQKYDRRGRPTGRRSEPLAADLRETGDGRRLGFLKIVAGMLGVGLDDLVQRDQLRRQRRLAGITGASLVGMIAALVLAVTAIQARDDARDQRREAEGLVAFMLGDLKDKLEPIGQLDALDGVGSRVLEYYSKQDASQLGDAGLMQRSRALSLTAQVTYLRGDLVEATRLYREAMAGTGEAVSRSPDDPQRLYDHAQNVFWIGDIARKRGQMGEAETAYREYKRLADRMVAIEPDNLKWRMEVAYGDHNLGIVYYYQRRFAEAAHQFEAALRPTESLASIDPDNAEYRTDQSTILAWLADARRSQGRLADAIALRGRQIALLHQATERDPGNVVFREHLIPARQALGNLHIASGQIEPGIEQFQLAIADADRLIPTEPDNNYWQGLAAQVRLDLSRWLLSAGRLSDAAREAGIGCGLAAKVLARTPGATWRRQRTACLALRARLALQAGQSDNALKFAERALASARTERSVDSIADQYSTAAAYKLLGDVRQRNGDRDAAEAAWADGLAGLPRNVNEHPWEMNDRAQLLERLGRTDEATLIMRRLAAIGFKQTS